MYFPWEQAFIQGHSVGYTFWIGLKKIWVLILLFSPSSAALLLSFCYSPGFSQKESDT